MSLSVVAHTYSGGLSTSPTTITITPTAAGQLIIVMIGTDSSSVPSISSSPSLTWTQQYSFIGQTLPGYGYVPALFYAISTSNSPISITGTSEGTHADVEAIVISGANINAPFDTNSSLDAESSVTNVTSTSVTFSTSSTDDLIITWATKQSTSSGNISFTTSFGNPVFLDGNGTNPVDGFAYINATSTLTNATLTVSISSTDNIDLIVFAIIPISAKDSAQISTSTSLIASSKITPSLHEQTLATVTTRETISSTLHEQILASLIASSKITPSLHEQVSLTSLVAPAAKKTFFINLSSSALEKITKQVVTPILHLSFNINLLLGGKAFPTSNLSILATIKNNTLFSLTENLKSRASLVSNALVLNKNIFLSSLAKVGPPTHLSFVISKSVIANSAVNRRISISSLLTKIIANERASSSVRLSANITKIISSSKISGEITLSSLAVIINHLSISGNSSIISNAILVNKSPIKGNININSFITINNRTFLDLTENIISAPTVKILSQSSILQENIRILSNLRILNQFISLSNHIGLLARVNIKAPLTSTMSVSTSVIVYKKIRTQIIVLLEPKSLELYLSPKD